MLRSPERKSALSLTRATRIAADVGLADEGPADLASERAPSRRTKA